MDKKFFQNVSFLKPFAFDPKCHGNIFAKSVKSIPIHMNNGVELLFVLEGEVRVKISFNFYDLKKGDFLLVNTFEVHSIYGTSPDNIVLFLEVENDYIFQNQDFFFAFDPHFYRTCKTDQVEYIKRTLVEAYLNYSSWENHNEFNRFIAIIGEICIKHFQIQNFDPINKEESPLIESDVKLERIGNTFKYFYQEHQEKILLKQLADREFIDKFYVSHLIKSGTGSSFQEMLSIIRIDRAEVLILGTDKKINEIFSEVGFSSYPYFVQFFKQFYQMSPSQYKKTYQSKTFPLQAEEFNLHAFNEEALKHELSKGYKIDYQSRAEILIKIDENHQDKEFILKALNAAGYFQREGSPPKERIREIIFKLK